MFLTCLTLCIASLNAPSLSLHDAESLALSRHVQILTARLDAEAAQYLVAAAERLANPTAHYSLGNVVVGAGYDQEQNLHPKTFEQTIQQIEVSKSIDLWWLRGPKKRHARLSRDAKKVLVEEAVRTLLREIRMAYAALLRESEELTLARNASARFEKSVALMRKRYELGDVPETTLLQIELENMHVANSLIEAQGEYCEARRALATLLLIPDASLLPPILVAEDAMALAQRAEAAGEAAWNILVAQTADRRSDVRAIKLEQEAQRAEMALHRRAALPPIELGVSYTRSKFQVSGDNPHVLGLALSVGLPLFDRNQRDLGLSRTEGLRLEAERRMLAASLAQNLATARDQVWRTGRLLACYEEGGMLVRAEKILAAQERQMCEGAISLLNFLEAERTFHETRASYLRARFARWGAAINFLYELGEDTNL